MAIVCTPKSKILSINTCVKHLNPLDLEIISWVDDDIFLKPDCLSNIISEYSSRFAGVYGARKVTIEGTSSFSRKWAQHKNSIEPVNLYPHGCCVVISKKEFGTGIPIEYMTDDHYLLLKYLDPNHKNPLARLYVIENAILYCPTALTRKETIKRIKRNYTNVLRILADAHPETNWYFLRHLMFPAIRFPNSIQEILVWSYWRKMFWHFLKFLFWLYCVIALMLRGLFRLPKGSYWYSADFSVKND